MKIEISKNKDTPLKVGKTFGKWILQFSFLARREGRDLAYCLCDGCKEKFWVDYNNLKRGLTHRCISCGHAASREKVLFNNWGKIPSELEKVCLDRWYAILSRCEDPKSRSFSDYGGRGIRLSEEFLDGRVFSEYAAQLPNADVSKEIDRINNEKGYERGNIKWATRAEQCRNQRTTAQLVFKGGKICARTWAESHSKFAPTSVVRLAKLGLTGEEILAREKTPGTCPRKRRPQKTS